MKETLCVTLYHSPSVFENDLLSVELLFEDETSEPGSSILYRILPLSPTNVTVSTDIFPDDLTPANASFTVTWNGPDSDSDFDRFLVKLPKQNITQVVGKYLIMSLTLFWLGFFCKALLPPLT